MSGHSKWAKTHRKKEVADSKKGAIFTRLGNLITMAARQGGGDLESNFQLRLVVDKAKIANMPKDNIDRAVKRGAGTGDGGVFEEMTYEIIGPDGSGFIAEAITDNKNRTVSNLKASLNKSAGQLGGPNSVIWMFDRRGLIIINPGTTDPSELELTLIDAGAEDINREDHEWEVYTQPANLQKTEQNIKALGIEVKESNLTYVAKDELNITNPDLQEKIDRLYSVIEDQDDVSNVYTNATW